MKTTLFAGKTDSFVIAKVRVLWNNKLELELEGKEATEGKQLYLSVLSFKRWNTNWGHCKLKLIISANQVKWLLVTKAPDNELILNHILYI